MSAPTHTMIDPAAQIASPDVDGTLTHGDAVPVSAGWSVALARTTEQELETVASQTAFTIVPLSGAFDRMVSPLEEQVWILERREACTRTTR